MESEIFVRVEKDMLDFKVKCKKHNFSDSVAKVRAMLIGENLK